MYTRLRTHPPTQESSTGFNKEEKMFMIRALAKGCIPHEEHLGLTTLYEEDDAIGRRFDIMRNDRYPRIEEPFEVHITSGYEDNFKGVHTLPGSHNLRPYHVNCCRIRNFNGVWHFKRREVLYK